MNFYPDFRLLSSVPQPRIISVQPKFLEWVSYVLPDESHSSQATDGDLNSGSIERNCEDDERAAKLRSQRAQEASVDLAWLAKQSQLTYPVSSQYILS